MDRNLFAFGTGFRVPCIYFFGYAPTLAFSPFESHLALSLDDQFPTGIISVVLRREEKEGEEVNYISKIDIMSQTGAGRES